ncbi:hypothetical protein DV707_14590 [Halobellus limi]|uniref:Uncharacterized protein n=1 Tax=Halobellus limi TaxID=699433 RepID=A0A4D6H4M3_9EURY|nr:hypothetical protein DV707_14590 [Halobellus limi]
MRIECDDAGAVAGTEGAGEGVVVGVDGDASPPSSRAGADCSPIRRTAEGSAYSADSNAAIRSRYSS